MYLTNLVVEPDKGSYSESIFFKTRLFMSSNNILDSDPMRYHPLHRTKYTVTIHNTEKHKAYTNVFGKAKNTTVLQPLWTQYVVVTADTIDGTRIYVEDTMGSEFVVGKQIFLYKQFDEANVATVANIGVNYIDVVETITVHKGMFLIPTFLGFVKEVVNTTYSSERFIKGDILIEELA